MKEENKTVWLAGVNNMTHTHTTYTKKTTQLHQVEKKRRKKTQEQAGNNDKEIRKQCNLYSAGTPNMCGE